MHSSHMPLQIVKYLEMACKLSRDFKSTRISNITPFEKCLQRKVVGTVCNTKFTTRKILEPEEKYHSSATSATYFQ
jgi:hypothetical protein